ncbi:VirB8/TrbF family protein [Methylotetracoccus oryzae]|uniref:VirB8/TrbF family protein n=1 Tax=Methylotetracoccus oryzae TaxID=1919059 RepID=UPI00111AD65D|nr:VirB8/TrbF family protein [Methylotetracoccus oryzae]
MTEPVTNPYLAARIQWNAHVGATLRAARIWQLVAVSALGIAAIAIGGALYLGAQSTFIPYVVEVDQLGQLQAVKIADRASAADERIIHASLASWITSARMVTPDVTLQREAIFKVYALLNPQDPATAKLNAWYGENEDASPFRRAEIETVAVEIHAVLPQSETTWRVDWSETTYTRDGAPKAPPQRMTALITVYLVPTTSATTEAEIRKNPLGLFIKDLSWSRQA